MERLFSNQFDDFEFIDFKPLTRGSASRCAATYYLSVSRHVGERKVNIYRTSLSAEASAIVVKKGLTHFRLRRDKATGELHIIFLFDTTGKCAPITFETNNETRRVRFNNKQLCDFLARHAGVEGNFSPIYFELSKDLSNSDQYATFKIQKLL